MSFSHDEGNLRFVFDDHWRVPKWDEHAAYVDGVQRLQDTKAVDFVALDLASKPWLIEVKDPRGHRIEYRDRLTDGSLVTQLAEKVRDTIAGLVWAHRRPPVATAEVASFVQAFFERDPGAKVFVVLWLEQDRPLRREEATALQGAIKRELRWLNPKVLVVSRDLAGDRSPVPGLSVQSLPGAAPPAGT